MDAASGTELSKLLGEPLQSQKVGQALQLLGLDPSPKRNPRRSVVLVSARDRGVGITFKPAEQLRDAESFDVSPDCLIASVIFFHAPGHEGYTGYPGVLPYGLGFTQSRAAVHALLGAPSGSSGTRKNDRWNHERSYLTIDFTDSEQSIQLVTVGLPWKPDSVARLFL